MLLMALLSRLAPKISDTERQALDAGTVWVEGDLFTGRVTAKAILATSYPALDPREQAFLDGPVAEVCRRVDPWRVSRDGELPEEIWEYLKAQGFFGLAIPEEHGGLGFSALGQSTVFARLASRSLGLSAVVLIPNSVGPGELLVHYGTEEQKAHYLPRLARGDEIPCFALTEPEAGSDAASLTSRGVAFRDDDGEVKLRLDFAKRYITLAPVATLLGLAFRLEDPDDLLGAGTHPGITVALVPTDLPGVEIGRRHDPMGIAFPNGPVSGEGVVVPASAILGGPAWAGRGWKMLMEALSAGRAISLPAQSAGGAQQVARVVSGYAAVRRQFGMPIGRMEGVEERLARIGGLTYLMEAARVWTCGAVDDGHRPAVVSAMVKYRQTELLREVVTDAMDVLAGAALSRGPKNPLGDAWAGAPIGITVEGANILTRSLIVFGQGALRCHPYLRRELEALEAGRPLALVRALAGHFFGATRTKLRWLGYGVTRGRLAQAMGRAPVGHPLADLWRKLAWGSARFAWAAEAGLLSLGPGIKRRESLSGRYADALSALYLVAAVLRRFEAEGRLEADEPLARWAAEEMLWRAQRAFEGIGENFAGWLGLPMRALLARAWRWHRIASPPSDRLGREVARRLQQPGPDRDRWFAVAFADPDPASATGRIEHALALTTAAATHEATLRDAVRSGRLPRDKAPDELRDLAVEAGVLTDEQAEELREAAVARRRAIEVDDFG
jgi:acyl-CoA dehydrogenase